jgi:hypothetical protein
MHEEAERSPNDIIKVILVGRGGQMPAVLMHSH